MTPFPSSSWRPSTRNYFGQRKKFEPTSPDAHACMRARTLHVPVSLIRSRPLLSSPAIMTKERSITSFFKPVNARPRDGDDAKAEMCRSKS